MSQIDKLIQELCPKGVEWKTLGEILTIKNGKDYKSYQAGDIPVYGSGGIMTYIDTPVFEKPSVLIPRKGSLGNLFYVDVPFWTVDTIFWTDINTAIVKPKFVYYYLQTQHLDELNMAGGVPSLTQRILNNVPIPIPPLPIQQEIVGILDTFTDLTAELTAELTARKKQYRYYREQLLSFNHEKHEKHEKVVWKTLGEVGEFTYGYVAKAQKTGNARFVRISDINENGKLIPTDSMYIDISKENEKYLLKKGDLLMARTGATYGKTLIFEEDYPAIYAGFLIKLKFDNSFIYPKFYWHIAQSELFWNQANKLVSGGGQPQFNANALKMVQIPIPPLEEQQRIVAILDKFDTLTTSISEGLPKEIKLRQQQYEYYRDRLLTFDHEKHEKHENG